jgi:peptidoglycan/LPS O-acetylase OafA/YrhL
MQTSPAPVGPPRAQSAQWLGGLSAGRLVAGVVLALLLLGSRWYEEAVYAWLDAGWRLLSRALPTAAADAVAGAAMRGLLERSHSVPAALLFAAGYVGLCWALLCVLLPPGQGWRWGLRLYGGVGLASLLLVVASHALGQPVLAELASRLLHMLLSPLPLMVLVPLLRWSGARAAG